MPTSLHLLQKLLPLGHFSRLPLVKSSKRVATLRQDCPSPTYQPRGHPLCPPGGRWGSHRFPLSVCAVWPLLATREASLGPPRSRHWKGRKRARILLGQMTVRKWGERPAKIWESLQTLREGRKGWVGVSQTDLQLMKALQGCQVVLKPIWAVGGGGHLSARQDQLHDLWGPGWNEYAGALVNKWLTTDH